MKRCHLGIRIQSHHAGLENGGGGFQHSCSSVINPGICKRTRGRTEDIQIATESYPRSWRH